MRKTNGSAPTLVDVAREASVSLKTASRVLNNEQNVSENKTLRVRKAMEFLGYRPNELARGLKAQRSAAIGMIVPNLSDPFTANAVHAAQEVARTNGYVLIIASSGGDVELERSEIISLVGRQIDGLIIAPADSRKRSFADSVPEGLPVVTFDQLVRGSGLDSVTVTNRKSAREATAHLVSHGFRNIAAIGARPYLYTCQERQGGYKAGMEDASLTERLCLVQHEDSLTPEWLEEEVLGRNQADAIFSLNWVCTTLTLRALRKLGKRPGVDIAMLSFDDFDMAEMMTPSLSAVVQPADSLGREAATLLFERLRGGRSKQRSVILPTNLVIRASCGCVIDAQGRPQTLMVKRHRAGNGPK
jgi:LacI family transcriptional regulator